MKIEKLTENKIQIIINPADLESGNLNVSHLTTTTIQEHAFFTKILEKAKQEVGFETEGCKLLIEIFSSNDEFLIFTITKYTSLEKKKPVAKRKIPNTSDNNLIYKFDSFEEFCEFCSCINTFKNFNIRLLSKKIDLYFYQNTYYLLIKNINNSYVNKKVLYSLISEFSIPMSFSSAFENKLIEYGNIIIRKNAIEQVNKYFGNN